MRTVPMTRASAVAAVAALLALAAPAWPALSAPADDNFLVGTPPPVDMHFMPPAGPPSGNLPLKTACVQASGAPQTLTSKPWGQRELHIEDAQRFATGAGITVAVIDTGIAANAYFNDRLSGGGDYVAPHNGLQDCDGHGTEVAGIIGANTPAEVGFKGVAPAAHISSIRTNSSNYGTDGPDGFRPAGDVATLATAIRKAADDGAKVINVSIAACFPPTSPTRDDKNQKSLQAAVAYARQQKDAVVVVAAGNLDPKTTCKAQNDDPHRVNTIASPAWYQGDVLTVAAIQSDGAPASFTLWGPWVDIAAPGTEIITLAPADKGLVNQSTEPNGQVIAIQGTSFAAPYVAGLAALVRERFPTLNATQVMDRIKKTAQHPAGFGGRNNKVGYGMINPVAALTAVIPEEHPDATPTTAPPLRANLAQYKHTDSTPMLVAMFGSFSGIALVGLTLFVVHTVQRARAQNARLARFEAARKRL